MTADSTGARAGADRFIRLHPSHPNVDYAYYLKALAAYRIEEGVFNDLFNADPAARDMGPVNESYTEFAIMLNTFPDSQYAPDARQRMLYLRELLARHELVVADYYLRKSGYVAAANRARFVIENYADTHARPDALAMLVEANWKLGLEEEADRALRVLALNHPDYRDFDSQGRLVLEERIRNRDRSWANIMTLGLLDRPEVPAPLTIENKDAAAAGADPAAEAEEAREEKKGRFSWLPFVD